MPETQAFPTLHVISAITGVVLTDTLEPPAQVLQFMAGEPVWAHQIPRVSREAGMVMLRFDPRMPKLYAEAASVNGTNWSTWIDVWMTRFGDKITVPRMNENEHERIDGLSEMAERIPPQRWIRKKP